MECSLPTWRTISLCSKTFVLTCFILFLSVKKFCLFISVCNTNNLIFIDGHDGWLRLCNIYHTSLFFQSVFLQPWEAALVRMTYSLSEAKASIHLFFVRNKAASNGCKRTLWKKKTSTCIWLIRHSCETLLIEQNESTIWWYNM